MPNTPRPSGANAVRREDNQNRKAAQEQGSEYQHVNSGRKAAGHGGGSLDSDKPTPDEHREPDYATSGHAQGQVPLRSREIEAEEELESRNGPYTREGRPASADTDGSHSSSQGGSTSDDRTGGNKSDKSGTSKP